MSIKDRYFLAANGFSGFRCHFAALLNSPEIKKLYIIKGGSGVGKSTLMRKVSAHFSGAGLSVEEILCSSDPSSLDGVLIRTDNGIVLLIDGTAPHEYDMKYPAARDHIIDLSRHLNEKKLYAEREKIEKLIKEKKKYYDLAYKYLHLAGNSYKILKEAILPYAKKDEISSLLRRLFNGAKNHVAAPKSRLYSSFSKSGLTTLDGGYEGYSFAYCFDVSFKSQILFSLLSSELCASGFDVTLFPSAFSDDIIDGFSVNNDVIFKTSDCAPTYSADCYFENVPNEDTALLSGAERIYENALESAAEALKLAFKNHIALEKIYGSAMDFEKSELVTKDLIEKIEQDIQN